MPILLKMIEACPMDLRLQNQHIQNLSIVKDAFAKSIKSDG
jgi:hypothetical protein